VRSDFFTPYSTFEENILNGTGLLHSSGSVTSTSISMRKMVQENFNRATAYINNIIPLEKQKTTTYVVTNPITAIGINWDLKNTNNNDWRGITYGNGLFVAVAYSGTGNRVMTSPDGLTWTIRTSAADNDWKSIVYGNGLFVAVAGSGAGNRVMTSPDGITWTIRTSAANNDWRGITYGNGLFVAVADSGTGNRVMTSPDGITWTIRTSAANNNWTSIVYGNGLFVAVAETGTDNRVMTSPDGITWTIRTSAADNDWRGITYGNGLFVAVAESGTGDRVMTSSNGIAWTIRTSAADNNWISITYGNGLFVAVAFSGTGDRVMTSPDGITWTIRTSAADNDWVGITYGNGLFVAVAESGTDNRVMVSRNENKWQIDLIDDVGLEYIENLNSIAFIDEYGNEKGMVEFMPPHLFVAQCLTDIDSRNNETVSTLYTLIEGRYIWLYPKVLKFTLRIFYHEIAKKINNYTGNSPFANDYDGIITQLAIAYTWADLEEIEISTATMQVAQALLQARGMLNVGGINKNPNTEEQGYRKLKRNRLPNGATQ